MFKNRLLESMFEGRWKIENRDFVKRNGGVNLKERIKELVEDGKIVTAGYLTTDIRNFHNHYILWRDKKSK